MTSTYELDLDILKLYLLTKHGVSRSRLSEVTAREQDRQTDATERISTPHSLVLNILHNVTLSCSEL